MDWERLLFSYRKKFKDYKHIEGRHLFNKVLEFNTFFMFFLPENSPPSYISTRL